MKPVATIEKHTLYTVLIVNGYERHVYPLGTGRIAIKICRTINDAVSKHRADPMCHH